MDTCDMTMCCDKNYQKKNENSDLKKKTLFWFNFQNSRLVPKKWIQQSQL